MQTATCGLAGPKLAETFGALVERCLRTDPAARAARAGSNDELDAVYAFVERERPELVEQFLDWCIARTDLPEATGNGIHIFTGRVTARVDTRTLRVELRAGWPEFYG